MGCKMSVSKATENAESNTGGKTLLKSHTTALNGDGPKLAKPHEEAAERSTDDRSGAAELPAGEPAAEPPTDHVQSTSLEVETRAVPGEHIIPLVASNDQVSQIAEAEAGKPSEPVKPSEEEALTKSPKRVSLAEAEVEKPLEPAELKGAVQSKENGVIIPPVFFAKGDFVNIVGPTANGNLAFKGKTGRVVHVDGGSIPYEVLVDQEKAYFKDSSLEKLKALNVSVSVDADANSSCCSQNSRLFGCCTEVKR